MPTQNQSTERTAKTSAASLPVISTYITKSQEETLSLGMQIAKELRASGPAIIALSGDLGSGKTTLAKGIIHGLTSIPIEEITSPTFQYASIFQSEDASIQAIHCDLWRLTSTEEFLELGLGELIHQGYCIIEWPDRINSILDPATKTIMAAWKGEYERQYSYFHELIKASIIN